MSFTTKVKNEILENNYSETEAMALVSSFVRNNVLITTNISLATENINTKKFLEEYIFNKYDVKVEISLKNKANFSKKQLYVLNIYDNINFILQDLGYYDKNNNYLLTPPNYITDSNSDIRGYLRGAFLSKGSINDPKTARYHMEIVVDYPDEAIFIQRLLNIFDLNAKILNRNKGYMVYLKEADAISDFLKILEVNNCVMYYESIMVYHDKKNKTNRLNNCEQANTDKAINAANNQLKYIEILKENLAINLLDDKVKDTLEYRIKYPEASLKELSEIIYFETGKKITKSGLNHHFRKIKDLASKF